MHSELNSYITNINSLFVSYCQSIYDYRLVHIMIDGKPCISLRCNNALHCKHEMLPSLLSGTMQREDRI